MSAVDGKLVVTSGEKAELEFVRNTEIYDPSTGSWTLAPMMQKERSSALGVLVVQQSSSSSSSSSSDV